MPTRSELQDLAQIRLREAQALFAAELYAGSYYLCGYVLELALKACVCQTLSVVDYPEAEMGGLFKSHKPRDLVLLAGLRDKLVRQRLQAAFDANWTLATTWGPDQRYQIDKTREDAALLLEAVASEPDGVLPWLSKYW